MMEHVAGYALMGGMAGQEQPSHAPVLMRVLPKICMTIVLKCALVQRNQASACAQCISASDTILFLYIYICTATCAGAIPRQSVLFSATCALIDATSLLSSPSGSGDNTLLL